MPKVLIEELNNAYLEVNKYKRNGYPTMRSVKIDIVRNPLIHQDLFNDTEEFTTSIRLEFKLDKDLGPRGSYILISEVEIIDDEL